MSEQESITYVTASVTRHETVTYQLEGPLTPHQALEEIESGAHDPVDSKIIAEEVDIVKLVTEQRLDGRPVMRVRMRNDFGS